MRSTFDAGRPLTRASSSRPAVKAPALPPTSGDPTPAAGTTAVGSTPPAFKEVVGHLAWGNDPATRQPWTAEGLTRAAQSNPALSRDLKRELARAKATVDQLPVAVVPKMFSEGLLAKDPRRKATGEAMKRLEDIEAWATAARLGPPDLQPKAQKAAVDSLLRWAKTYKPDGNPINEHRFVAVFKAADQVMPLMNAAQQKTMRGWMKSFITASERYPLQGMCKVNNWKTFNLQIRGTAAQVLGDQAALKKVSGELEGLLKKTIRADGSSLDFHHRDAFHYHLYNSEGLLDLAQYAPAAVTSTSKRLIEKTFAFVEPYYLGQKKHVEFKNTQVAFDHQRAAAGQTEYQPHEWNPREADALLGRARALFPTLRPWTGAAEVKRGTPADDFAASLRWPARPVA